MVNVSALEVPPPGAGFTTVTDAVPAVRISEAGTCAVSLTALTNVVGSFTPFQSTAEPVLPPLTKPVPFTVRVKLAPPIVALLGMMEVIAGTGLLMLNVNALEVPPPGPPLNTVTDAVPALLMSIAVIAAVTLLAFTNVVVRFDPFHFTLEPEMKFVPFTVSVKAAPPAMALLGERVVAVGTGLLIVKVIAEEVPPPGGPLNAVTAAVPAVAMSEASMAAVTFVALTNVVVRAEPFHFTCVPATKFVPFTVSVNPGPPAVALLGEIEVSVGAGLSTAKLLGLDVPPPGAGLNTVTGNVPADGNVRSQNGRG